MNEHHAYRRLAGRAIERRRHLGIHRDRQRVLLVGPVDLDAQDAVGDVGEDETAHGASWVRSTPQPATDSAPRRLCRTIVMVEAVA